MLILIWIQDERSYDRYHHNHRNIYRIVSQAGKKPFVALFGGLGPALAREYSEVAGFTRLTQPSEELARSEDRSFFEEDCIRADPSIFDIFTFSFIAGPAKNPLPDPSSVVLTRSMANKYFGREDPLGMVLRIGSREDFIVTAVIEDLPRDTHLRFSVVRQFEPIGEFVDIEWDHAREDQ